MLIPFGRRSVLSFLAYLPLLSILLLLFALAMFLAQLVLKPALFGFSPSVIKIEAARSGEIALIGMPEVQHRFQQDDYRKAATRY